MPSNPESPENFFGQGFSSSSADDFFGKDFLTPTASHSGPVADTFYGVVEPFHRVLSAFGQGVQDGWGAIPNALGLDQQDAIKKAGLSDVQKSTHEEQSKSFNEAFIRPAIHAAVSELPHLAWSPFQAASAVIGGIGEAGVQAGTELTGAAKSLEQYAPLPAAVIGEAGEGLQAVASGQYFGEGGLGEVATANHIRLENLNKFRSEGKLGEGEEGYFNTKPVSDENLKARADALGYTGLPGPEVRPLQVNIHEVAKQIDPYTFQEYDRLAEMRDNLRADIKRIGNLRGQDTETDILHLLSQSGGDEARLSESQTTKLYNLRRRLADEQSAYSPEMQSAQQRLVETDYQLRDLATTVSDTYEHAKSIMGDMAKENQEEWFKEAQKVSEEPEEVPGKENNPSTIALEASQKLQEAGRPKDEADAAAAVIQARYTARAARFKGKLGTAEQLYGTKGPNIIDGEKVTEPVEPSKVFNQDDIDHLHNVTDLEAVRNEKKFKEALAAGVKESQEDAYVPTHKEYVEGMLHGAADVINKATMNGLPGIKQKWEAFRDFLNEHGVHALEDEGLVDQLASLKSDALKAIQTYRENAKKPGENVVSLADRRNQLNQGIRGKLVLGKDAKNTIVLFKTSDASTIIHELGHQFLQELMEDALHAEAPDDLKADAVTIKDWLGVKKTGGVTRKQHEKFARGFERYLMEGKAPSPELASVFAKFKQWLTEIYQSVAKLRSPINDNVRGVFDRLLTTGEKTEEAGKETVDVLGQAKKAEARPQVGVLNPITGTGESVERGLSRGIETKAIEKGISEKFGDLPEYRRLSMEDQANQASELINRNYPQAQRIAMGREAPPAGILPESVLVAVEEKAISEGDSEFLRELASSSRLTVEATTMGQRIRTLAERSPDSPVSGIKSVQDARERHSNISEMGQGKAPSVTPEEAKIILDSSNKVKQAEKRMQLNDTPETRRAWGRARMDYNDTLNKMKPGGMSFNEALIQVLGVPKQALTGVLHFTAPFVQNWGLMTTKQWGQAWPKMFSYFYDEENYNNLIADIISHPDYKLAKDGQLGLTDLGDKFNNREEANQTRLLEMANEYVSDKTNLPNVLRASSRGFTGFNNYVRFYRFVDLLNAARLAGEDVKIGSPIVKDLATAVNDFSGRGKIWNEAGYGGSLSTVLNAVFFAPKKLAATMNMFNPAKVLGVNPVEGRFMSATARNARIRQLSGSIIATGAVLSLAQAYGYSVNLNPISTDFLTVNVGGQKFDMTGGNAIYTRLLARLVMNKEETAKGKEVVFGEGYNPQTRAGAIADFLRGKLAPVSSTLTDYLYGKDQIGRPFNIEQEARDKLMPIVAGQFMDYWQNNPDDSAAMLPSLLSMFGVSMRSPLPTPSQYGVSVWGDHSTPFSPAPKNAIDREIERLGGSYSIPPKTINGVKLTDDEHKQYIVQAGQQAKSLIEPMMSSPNWSNMKDKDKLDFIKSSIQMGRSLSQTALQTDSLAKPDGLMNRIIKKDLGQ